LHFGKGVGLPAGAALAEDAPEQLVGRLVVAAFLAGEFGFRGNQAALAGSLEHRGAIPLEIRLHPLKRCRRRILSRELFLDLGNDLLMKRQIPVC
jgi:hypothetical protein